MYRVIIVEDEPEIARSTKRLVEKKADFQVTAIFSNGQEALNYIWLDPVDLIILDLFMPQMNGREFLYRLRKEDLHTEVIIVTGNDDAGNIRDVLSFGIVDYLLKPFSAVRFSKRLTALSSGIRSSMLWEVSIRTGSTQCSATLHILQR